VGISSLVPSRVHYLHPNGSSTPFDLVQYEWFSVIEKMNLLNYWAKLFRTTCFFVCLGHGDDVHRGSSLEWLPIAFKVAAKKVPISTS